MMDILASYIPLDRRHAIASNVSLPDRTGGAALFADISGFTALTEALVQALGVHRGVEELPRQLNSVYDALISVVDGYGGSVVGFSGDAVTCWFDQDDGLLAVACALAMQAAMQPFAALVVPEIGPISLAIKVAVAVGSVRRFLVGNPTLQQIDVLAGSTLAKLAAAEHVAGRGEVVVDQDVVEPLRSRIEIAAWRSDTITTRRLAVVRTLHEPPSAHVPAPEPALSEDQLRPWLLPAIYDRLRMGQGEFLAELRPAVALFLCFEGLDYDEDPLAGRHLDAYIRTVQDVLTRYGGSLIQLTFGDKGSYLYAAFGAPIAHDDDALRAAGAALDLLALQGAVRTVGIGISQGRMRVGSYGGTTRRTYGVLGDDSNVAARLMTQAEPGQILVSDRVAPQLEPYFELDPLGTITLKGKQAPLTIAALRARRFQIDTPQLGRFTTPLIGRKVERAALARYLAGARNGAGAVLRLQGGPGMGKSHLLSVLLDEARRSGMQTAGAICQSTTRDLSYGPWRQIVRALLSADRPVAQSPSQLAADLHDLIAELNVDWLLRLPLLGDLLDLPIPDNATTAALEPQLRRAALVELLIEMLARWSRSRPLLLVIDAAQWIDEASIALTLALSRSIAHLPFLLVLAHRAPEVAENSVSFVEALAGFPALLLGDLQLGEMHGLITALLGASPSPLVNELICLSAQGNPYFAEALLTAMQESGQLHVGPTGQWRLSPQVFTHLRQGDLLVYRDSDREWVLAPGKRLAGADLGLPESVQGAVLARLDQLPEEPKLLLKVASVVGATFSEEVARLAHPLAPAREAASADLEVLEERDFIQLHPGSPPGASFRHTLTRDVVYETLLFSQRERLHQAIGATLEWLSPDAVEQIAYHSFAGADWSRALRYHLLAGRRAKRLFTNHAALDHYVRALQCLDHLDADERDVERQDIDSELGELYLSTGDYAQAQHHLERAHATAEARRDSAELARICRLLARLYELRGEFQPALEWIDRSLVALAGRPSADAVEAFVTGGLIHTRRGDFPQAQELAERALALGEELGEPVAMARAMGLLGIIARRRGSGPEAIQLLEKALDLYRSAENVHGRGLVHNELANCYFDQGLLQDAEEQYRLARAIFSQIGDLYNQALAANNLGGIAQRQCRFDEAVTYYQEGLQALEATGGSPYVLGVFQMNLGAAAVGREDVVTARTHLARCLELFEAAEARDFLPEAYRVLAEAALLANDLAEAQTAGLRSLEVARELALPGEEGSTLRVLGETARARGDFDEAERLLRDSLLRQREAGDAYAEARTELALASVLADGGRHAETLAALDRCVPVFERLSAARDLTASQTLARSLRDRP